MFDKLRSLIVRLRGSSPESVQSNSSSADAVRSAADRNAMRQRRDDSDLAWILSDRRGRRALGVLIYDLAGVRRLSLSDSEAATAANEGARNLALQLLAHIERVDFEASMMIQIERREDAITESASAKQAQQEEQKERFPVVGDMPIR